MRAPRHRTDDRFVATAFADVFAASLQEVTRAALEALVRLRMAQVVDVASLGREEVRRERVAVGGEVPRATDVADVPRVLALRNEVVVPQRNHAVRRGPCRLVGRERYAAETWLPCGG